MCCLTTIFLVLGSRIALFLWWLADPQRFDLAFKNWAQLGNYAIPAWIWTVLGGIFLPWTTLAYLFVFPGGIVGYEWIVLGVAFLIDLAGHGGGFRHRNRIPVYQRR
jgi:hypothetical protein